MAVDPRKIDRLCAEHVMGWESMRLDFSNDDIPHYSTDIAAAWEVVEKLCDMGCWVEKRDNECQNDYKAGFHFELETVEAIGHTAPMAIALASLKAKGVDLESVGVEVG